MSTHFLQRIAAGSLGLALAGLLSPGLMLPARGEVGTPQVGSRPVKVAAVDFIPAWGDRDGNIRRLVQAAERVAAAGVQYAVFPETAISGYDFADPAQLAPFVDTIPGRASAALLPVLKRTGMLMSVGIAEKDANTGIFYNTAVLMGPEGIIGKYRKNGLNGQDVQLFGPGDTDVGVFDTPIGRIALIICYDDTYWQYDRLAALRGAQIIGWHSVSDRVMPGTPPAQARANHSTVASVQHMSALNGLWVIGATRSGIERNPINRSQLYYNGGSSIWSPQGRKLVQAPVVPPVELPPGLNGIFATTIIPAEADAVFDDITIYFDQMPPAYQAVLAAIAEANGRSLEAAAMASRIDKSNLTTGEKDLLRKIQPSPGL
jgi:predicted amidohydrolase